MNNLAQLQVIKLLHTENSKRFVKIFRLASFKLIAVFIGVTTFSIMTVSITTFSIMTFRIYGLFVTLGINGIQHKKHSA
jgi:hypothetical protein